MTVMKHTLTEVDWSNNYCFYFARQFGKNGFEKIAFIDYGIKK